MQRLALDHITAIDTTPVQLAEAARMAGCVGMCLFMEPMVVLPLMPQFEIYDDLAARRELNTRMADLGVVLDLAYPFTLAGRTVVAAFAKALECAADLGAGLVNVLIYDRDPARRQDAGNGNLGSLQAGRCRRAACTGGQAQYCPGFTYCAAHPDYA